MKIETAIENLQAMIDCNEKYEAFLTGEDDSDEELRDTELTLETLRMAKRALEEKPRWIPCTERLPEMQEYDHCGSTLRESDKVLFSAAGRVRTGCCVRFDDNKLHWETKGRFVCEEDVTAWMPLPEAYKEVFRK